MQRLVSDQRGTSSVEYVVLLVLVCALSVAAWNVFGDSVGCRLARAASALEQALGGSANSQTLVQCGAEVGTSGFASALASHGTSGVAGSATGRKAADTARAPKKPPASAAPASKAAIAQAWANDIKKTMCPGDKAFLAAMRKSGVKVTLYDRIYYEDPYFDGSKWTTKHFEGGGSSGGTQISIVRSGDAKEDASTLFHEGTHSQQPSSMKWRDKEYDAYGQEDAWRMSQGLPAAHPSFRTKGPGGVERTDHAAIRSFVDTRYPGVTSTPAAGGGPEQVVGRTKAGETIVERANGTRYTRPPKAGDSYGGPEISQPKGGVPVSMASLQCP